MTKPWWSGLSPVEFRCECGGAQHRVVWADGELHAPDHPDADRERALAALGADPFPCLDLLDEWRRHAEDLDVLVLGSRGPPDAMPVDADEDEDEDAVVAHAAYYGRYAPMSMARRSRPTSAGWTMYSSGHAGAQWQDVEDERPQLGVEDLLRLGHGLPERLIATVIGTWADRVEAGDDRAVAARPQLQAALYGRLLATVRGWTGTRASLDLVMARSDDGPSHLSREGDHLVIEVPFSWLRDVWVKGLATVLGQLCLMAEQTSEDEWHLLTASGDEPTTFAEWRFTRSVLAEVVPIDG